MKIGFDNDYYVKIQTENISKRIEMFENKLYMEFGGKLFDDLHASRVLPGFLPDVKIRILKSLKDKCEIIFVINANHIENHKIRADFNLTYDEEVLRQIDNLRAEGLNVSAVVITLFSGQHLAENFATKLKNRGENVYFHSKTKGYPNDVSVIVSDEGYGANPYIKTTKPLVVVTAPGPGSGKLATCLSQLYHEYKNGVKAGYAKFETFPVFNLDLKHPVNIAYEAATADLKDINMIDSFHLSAYGKVAVNYNRDLECFPVVSNIITKIAGAELYKSPTDMGVNMVGFAITDDDVVRDASKKEIVRRYQKACVDFKCGLCDKQTVSRIEMLMSELSIGVSYRQIVEKTNNRAKEYNLPIVGIELEDGKCVFGKKKDICSASSSCVLNCLKTLAGIDDSIDLIPENILLPVCKLKREHLKVSSGTLSLQDTLIALAISSSVNPLAQCALKELKNLNGLEAHSSCILDGKDEQTLKNLGIRITCEPVFVNDVTLTERKNNLT